MRIMVVSDTHGDCSRVYEAYKKLRQTGSVDMIIHCGDYYKDSKQIAARLGVSVYGVPGNCDGSYNREDCHVIETECGNILVTHGHMQNVNYSMENLYYFAEEKGCVAAIFGHTHRGAFTRFGQIHLFNPGSISRPRDGSGGSFGLIITGKNSFWGKVYDYSAFMAEDVSAASAVSKDAAAADSGDIVETAFTQGEANPAGRKKHISGGKLRDMINYSDRF